MGNVLMLLKKACNKSLLACSGWSQEKAKTAGAGEGEKDLEDEEC
jgi:hypothetical protein